VVPVRAAPIPCKYLARIRWRPVLAKLHKNDATVNIIIPPLKSLLTPVRSPHRPAGNKNIAVANKNEVTTQLRETAPSPRLFSIDGRAIFTEEIRKVPINEETATMVSIEICFLLLNIQIDKN
jgi:hypothetical protein